MTEPRPYFTPVVARASRPSASVNARASADVETRAVPIAMSLAETAP